MKKTILLISLGMTSLFAAFGDKIDMDATTTTVNGSAVASGDPGAGAFKLWSRTCCEIGKMNNDNSVGTKNSTETLVVSIPEQSGVNRYELAFYGKKKTYDVIYDMAIDGGSATTNTVSGFSEAEDTPVYYKSYIVNGSAHTMTISGTNATSNWIEFDYFEVLEIPAPIIGYTPGVTEPVAQDFDGVVGLVAITNQGSLKGDAATITLSDNDNFGFAAGTLTFKTPADPAASYTVTITADHMGETATQEVTLEIAGVTPASIDQVHFLNGQSDAVRVYDLEGNLIKASATSKNWQTGVAQGVYIVHSAHGKQLNVIK